MKPRKKKKRKRKKKGKKGSLRPQSSSEIALERSRKLIREASELGLEADERPSTSLSFLLSPDITRKQLDAYDAKLKQCSKLLTKL